MSHEITGFKIPLAELETQEAVDSNSKTSSALYFTN